MEEYLAKESIYLVQTYDATITKSLKEIINIEPDFIELFLLISLFNPKDIPYKILVNNAGNKEDLIDHFIDKLKKHFILEVRSFSQLISKSDISVSNNNQKIIYNYIKKSLNLENYNSLVNSIVNKFENHLMNVIDAENLSEMKALIKHCEALVKQEVLPESLKINIEIQLGEMYHYFGDYKQSLRILENVYEKLKVDKK
jgi:hypothetical protein